MKSNLLPYSAIISSPAGNLGIKIFENKLHNVDLLIDRGKTKPATDEFTQQIITELHCYFKNPQHKFKIPLKLIGTPFQLKVWRALTKIPVGKTLTYGELAQQLKTSPRAIGNACRNNPVPIVIPCHRITAQNGIGGFSGKTCGAEINLKSWMLALENNTA